MQPLARIVAIALWLAVLAAPGCRLFDTPTKGKTPLAPLQAGEDSVALEIFFARFHYGYPPFAEKLWEEVDEQVLPADVRRELARNGFRAGIVGSQVPVELARMLTLTDVPQPHRQGTTVDLEKEPTVKLRLLEVRSGRRGEIIASPVYDHLPLLMREGENVKGKTYDKADGRFVLQGHTPRRRPRRARSASRVALRQDRTKMDPRRRRLSPGQLAAQEGLRAHAIARRSLAGPDAGADLPARPSGQSRPLLFHRAGGRRTVGPADGDRAPGPGRVRPFVFRNRFGRNRSGHRTTRRQPHHRRGVAGRDFGQQITPAAHGNCTAQLRRDRRDFCRQL